MLTPEQQQTIDRMTALFEAANAEVARREALLKPVVKLLTPQEQADKAAALRLEDGQIPDGVMVMENGKYVSKSREAAIIGLAQGLYTL
jgi:hypothetical protein